MTTDHRHTGSTAPASRRRTTVPGRRRAAWGLFAAWLVHDLEELVTLPRWMTAARPRLQRRFPHVPATAWRTLSPDRAHATLAITFMGCLVAAAAHRGARTAGSSALAVSPVRRIAFAQY